MCGCFYIEFIDFMLKGKSLLGYTNLFSPHDDEKNDKIIFFESTKLKIVWKNFLAFFKQRVSIML